MTLASSQFRVVTVQAIAFVASAPAGVQAVQLALLSALRDDLEPESVELRTLAQLPTGIPFLSARSRDGAIAYDVSMSTISARWRADATAATLSLEEAMETCAAGVVRCAEAMGVTVGRVAAVVQRVVERDHPGIELSRIFCKQEWLDGTLNRPEGFELHAHKQFEFGDGFRVNSWMRIRTGGLQAEDGSQKSIVHVEQDQNTLAERLEADTYDGARMLQFFAHVVSELDGVVALYFPEPV